MTPSGSVAGHLTDLVSGEVRWARARVPASPSHQPGLTQSGQSGSRELSGTVGERRARVGWRGEERRAPVFCPAGTTKTGVRRWRCWNLSISCVVEPPVTVTASPAHPSSFPPPRAGQGFPCSASRRNGQCQAGQDNQGLAVSSHNRRFFFGKFQTEIGFDAEPSIDSPLSIRAQKSNVREWRHFPR